MAIDWTNIANLRRAVTTKSKGFADAYWAWSQDPDNSEKQSALASAREAEAEAITALNSAIQADFSGNEQTLAGLGAKSPIILLPVRLETRIVGDQMLVRIYPDEIWVDLNQRALTPEEFESGAYFWQKKLLYNYWTPGEPWPTSPVPEGPAQLDSDQERELWDRVVKKHGNRRGAWIVRAMLPSLPTAKFSTLFNNPAWVQKVRDGSIFWATERAPDQWSSPGRAVLPDQWCVVAYRDGVEKQRKWTSVLEPLQITTDPRANEDEFGPLGDGSHKIENALKWTVDFEEAKKVGMATELSLVGQSDPKGFEKIVVVGVKTSMSESDVAEHLAALFDSHHYSRGAAFTPQGTPTNNTETTATPFNRIDDDYDSFVVEWEELAISLGTVEDEDDHEKHDGFGTSPDYTSLSLSDYSNARVMTRAFGVSADVFASIRGAGDEEQARAKLMNHLLFPATLGYLMDQVVLGTFVKSTSINDWESAREYFEEFVRGRGPLPAFRIGAVPYGVLPVVSLKRWKSAGTSDDLDYGRVETAVRRYLVTYWDQWVRSAEQLARRLNRQTSIPPEQQLLGVLAMHASARSVWVRRIFGGFTAMQALKRNGASEKSVHAALERVAAGTFGLLASPARMPSGQAAFQMTAENRSLLFSGPMVVPAGSGSVQDYIQKLTSMSAPTFWADLADPKNSGPFKDYFGDKTPPLFWILFRHAMMVRYMTALNHHSKVPVHLPFNIEQGLQVIWPPNKDEANSDFNDWLSPEPSEGGPEPRLADLKDVAADELERLLTETLDLVSHRFDAWATALATRRLATFRSSSNSNTLLGGFGWVENVWKGGNGGVAPGGFIQAPSLAQANAAAILREGYLADDSSTASAKAIDISSARTRSARLVLDEIRAGQELGAVLGARFEKILHEDHPISADIEVCLASLRKTYPLPTTNLTDSNGPVEATVPNVVNGQTMLAYYLAHGRKLYPNVANPTAAQKAVNAAAEAIAVQMDAVADLVTSESVYQLAKGNINAVNASAESLARGYRPSDPQIARGQEGGIDVSQRVVLVFPKGQISTTAEPPRRLAEPRVDRWAESMLGNLSWTVTYTKTDTSLVQKELTLTDLGMCALDLIAMFQNDRSTGLTGSLLERALIEATTQCQDYASGPSAITENVRSVAQLGVLARTLSQVLTSSRPLKRSDLVDRTRIAEAGEVKPSDTEDSSTRDLSDRAQAARLSLYSVSDKSTKGLLVGLAKYIPAAYPPPGATGEELYQMVMQMVAEQQRRLKAAEEIAPSSSGETLTVEQSSEMLKAVFGRDFIALPAIQVPFADELQASLDNDWATEDEARRTLDKMAISRDPLRAWRLLNATTHITGTSPGGSPVSAGSIHLKVAQLPMVAGEAWVGRSTTDGLQTGRLSLIVGTTDSSFTVDDGADFSGVVLDDWTERIPSKTVDIGVSFHSESPAAEAPQTVLIAVPSSNLAWTTDELIAVVSQTLELAKVRALELSSLGVGQYLPATLLAFAQTNNETVSSEFSAASLRAAPQRSRRGRT